MTGQARAGVVTDLALHLLRLEQAFSQTSMRVSEQVAQPMHPPSAGLKRHALLSHSPALLEANMH